MKLTEFFSLKNDNPIKPQPSTPPIVAKEKWALVDRKEIRKVYDFSTPEQRLTFLIACLKHYDQEHRPLDKFQMAVEGLSVTFRLFGSDALGILESDIDVARVFEGIYCDVRAGRS